MGQNLKRELKQLLADLAEGDLDEAQARRLEEILQQDPTARELYQEYIDVHVMLQWMHAPPDPSQTLPVPHESTSARGSDHADTLQPKPSNSGRLRALVAFFARPTPFSMTVAALFMGLLVTAMALLTAPIYRAVTGGGETLSPVFVAELTAVDQAVWADGQVGVHPGSQLIAGHRMDLKEGLAEVTFRSGAQLVVRGPSVLILRDVNTARMQRGEAVARVNDKAKGFCLETDSVRVIDLGTEFGLAVESSGDGEVIVYEGKVEVISTDPPRQFHQQLAAGEHLAFSAAGELGIVQSATDVKPKQLARRMPGIDGLDEDATYEELIAALRPVAWYRMERGDGRRLTDSSTYGNHGRVVSTGGNEDCWQPGRRGDALALRGNAGEFAIVPDYPKAASGRMTVMAWVYADSKPGWSSIAKNWGASHSGQFHFGLTENGASLSTYIKDASGAIVAAVDSQPFPDGKWQHVAFVCTGSSVQLYRQGRIVASESCRGVGHPLKLKALGIGCKLNDAENGASQAAAGFWDGRLDEVVIFNESLSSTTLRRLMQASTSAHAGDDP